MNRNKNNTKNIKKLIILLALICIILLVLILVIYNNPTDKTLRYIYNTKEVGIIDIMPTNVDKLFSRYEGNNDQRSLYKSMDLFVNEFIQNYYLETKNLSKDDLKKYFNENSKKIKVELGITEEENFNSFCNNLKNTLNSDDLKLISYTINPISVKKYSSHIAGVMIVKYGNNQKIAFYLTIRNKIDESKSPITYAECTDEEMIKYEYIENDYETPETITPTGRVIK